MATKEVVVRFQQLNKDINNIHTLLEMDATQPLGDAPNLLLIHYQLFRLEKFKDEAILKAKQQGTQVLQIVTRYFKRLDALSDRFREYVLKLARNMLDLIKENQGSVIVRLAKIIEVEEQADERVLAMEQRRPPSLTQLSERSPPQEEPRTVKNYRSEMFNAIHEFITTHFQKKTSSSDGSMLSSLQALNFVFEDLAIVFEELAPRFPPKYKIFSFYVLQYHKNVYDYLNRLTAGTLETREILLITGWVRDYYRTMTDRFGVSEELLEPRLLDDNEEKLVHDYVSLIQKKLKEWVDRLLFTEGRDFSNREKPPETEVESIYCTSAAVILFQMINQQIDVAMDAARGGRLLLDVAKQCLSIARYFQDAQWKMVEAEEQRFMQRVDNFPPGFPEYVIAVSNNHFRCSEFVEVLQKRLDQHLDDRYRSECSREVGETMDGFLKVAKRGYQTLINIVFHDVGPAFTELFSPYVNAFILLWSFHISYFLP
jgi:exocyst complex component 3